MTAQFHSRKYMGVWSLESGHCEHGEVVSHDSGCADQQEHQKQEELELLSLGELQDKF